MNENINSLLLPIGIENQFFVPRGDPSANPGSQVVVIGFFAFEQDLSAFRFLAEEFLSRGALEVHVDSYSAFSDYFPELPPAFRKRVKKFTKNQRQFDKACSALLPVAAELDIELKDIGPHIHSWMGPQIALVANERDETRKRMLSHLLSLLASLFHILVGMKCRAQIDIGLDRAKVAAECLRRYCKSPEATANLSVIQGLLRSYDSQEIGALRLAKSASANEIAERFEEFLHDEVYRNLSEETHLLGIPRRVKRAVARTHQLAKKLVRMKSFSGVFNYGSKAISASTGIPAPSSDIAQTLLGESYLPPIGDLMSSIAAARKLWRDYGSSERLSISSPFTKRNPVFSPTSKKYEDGSLRVRYDIVEFLSMYRFSGEPDEEHMKKALEEFFSESLEQSPECQEHGKFISRMDIDVKWLQDSVLFEVVGCCEKSTQLALLEMLSVGE